VQTVMNVWGIFLTSRESNIFVTVSGVSEKNKDIGIAVCPLMAIFDLVTADYIVLYCIVKRLKLEFHIEFISYCTEM